MFRQVGTFFYKAVQSKWINIIGLPILGIFFITKGYAFLQDDPGDRSGPLFCISGSLWILCGVFELFSHYLNVVHKSVVSVITALMAISAAVLIFIAL